MPPQESSPDPTGAVSPPSTRRKVTVKLRDECKLIANLQDPWTACDKICWHKIRLFNWTTEQPSAQPSRGGRDKLELNTAELMVDHRLWEQELGIHHNSPLYDTKLAARLGIDFISPPLVADTLIPFDLRVITSPPKMSPWHEVECMPADIIKPWLNTY